MKFHKHQTTRPGNEKENRQKMHQAYIKYSNPRKFTKVNLPVPLAPHHKGIQWQDWGNIVDVLNSWLLYPSILQVSKSVVVFSWDKGVNTMEVSSTPSQCQFFQASFTFLYSERSQGAPKTRRKKLLGRPGLTRNDNIKMNQKETECEVVHWIRLAQDGVQYKALVKPEVDL